MRVTLSLIILLAITGLIAAFFVLGAVWIYLYLVAAVPGMLLLLAIRTLPAHWAHIRAYSMAAVSALFFAPYLGDFDRIPVIRPVYVAFLDYTFPLQSKYSQLIVSALLVFGVSLWLARRRSKPPVNADAERYVAQ